MSTRGNHTRGPDVPTTIIRGAFVGAVATLVLIPVFREVLLQLGAVHRSLSPSENVFSEQVAMILAAGDAAFVLVSIGGTVGGVLFAYSRLGLPGIALSLFLSSAAAGMVLGSTAAIWLFVLGSIAVVLVSALKCGRSSRHRGW